MFLEFLDTLKNIFENPKNQFRNYGYPKENLEFLDTLKNILEFLETLKNWWMSKLIEFQCC